MIKICYVSICKPLELIFRSCLENGKFPTEWKKANVVPAHKKGDKQRLKNYHPQEALVQTKTEWYFGETIWYHHRFSKFKKIKSCFKWTIFFMD